MKLQTNGIDHSNLDVKNLDESVRFYCDLFGFAILKDQPKAKSKIIGNDTVKPILCNGGSETTDHCIRWDNPVPILKREIGISKSP